jgi:hypothetical protein
LICEDPGAAWRIRYRGPARPTQSAELQRGPLTEAEQYLLDLDLAFTSKRPVWQMTGIAGEKWGKFHTEQTGRIRGHIVYDGRTIEMDGLGWRDHSRDRATSAAWAGTAGFTEIYPVGDRSR